VTRAWDETRSASAPDASSRVDERVGEVGDRADQAGRQIFEGIGVEQRGEAIGVVEDDEVAGGVVAEGAAAGRDAEVARALAGGGREVAVGVGGQLGDAAADGDGLAQVLEVIDGDRGADEGAVEGEEDAPTDRAVLIDRRVGTAIVGAGDQRRDGGDGGEERGARDHDDDLLGGRAAGGQRAGSSEQGRETRDASPTEPLACRPIHL
jgi:hypothetical protein